MSYQEIEKSLQENGIGLKLEECHAIVSACVCINPERGDWLEVSDCLARVREWTFESARLALIFEALQPPVHSSLAQAELGFQLLIPDEQIAETGSRVTAFANWCAGFLAGLSVITKHYHLKEDELSSDTRSFLSDLSRFVDLDNATNITESDRAANDLFELIEYCRLGVIGIFLDLENSRALVSTHPSDAPIPKSIN